jgi:hypothetical protein
MMGQIAMVLERRQKLPEIPSDITHPPRDSTGSLLSDRTHIPKTVKNPA